MKYPLSSTYELQDGLNFADMYGYLCRSTFILQNVFSIATKINGRLPADSKDFFIIPWLLSDTGLHKCLNICLTCKQFHCSIGGFCQVMSICLPVIFPFIFLHFFLRSSDFSLFLYCLLMAKAVSFLNNKIHQQSHLKNRLTDLSNVFPPGEDGFHRKKNTDKYVG